MQTSSAKQGRKIYKGAARERYRLLARYEIQERMRNAGQRDDDTTTAQVPIQPNAPSDRDFLQETLQRLGKNNAAFFSLKNLNDKYELLNKPFPVEGILWWTNDEGTRRLATESRLLGLWGHETLNSFKADFLAHISSCTLVEWAVWTERENLLPTIMMGGIDVTRHGSQHGEASSCRIDPVLGKRFFFWRAPLYLKAYIAKRVHALRKRTLENWPNDKTTGLCQLCTCSTSKSCMLCFDDCQHQLCDSCLWNDILDHSLRRFHRPDIFVCPLCDSDNNTEMFNEELVSASDAKHNREKTLRKFQELPVKSPMLDKAKRKHRLRSSWASAASIGWNKSTRMEKYWKLLDNIADETSYHLMQLFLQDGVDMNARGEYGQTGLWIAVWKQEVSIVRLLLRYGSDPNESSNGGISCMHLAEALGRMDILETLIAMGGSLTKSPIDLISAKSATMRETFSVTTLIDIAKDHEGAGSYVFDDFLESHVVKMLQELRDLLPVAPTNKGEGKLCSVRSYYCDAIGAVVQPLTVLMAKVFGTEDVMVFPYMRFLFYTYAGTSLAPHNDLSRVDAESGIRSTHSFLLYLSTCEVGGETELIQGLPEGENNIVMASVKPVSGRLLLFPHKCPHRGLAVVDVPKHLIRGEVYIPPHARHFSP